MLSLKNLRNSGGSSRFMTYVTLPAFAAMALLSSCKKDKNTMPTFVASCGQLTVKAEQDAIAPHNYHYWLTNNSSEAIVIALDYQSVINADGTQAQDETFSLKPGAQTQFKDEFSPTSEGGKIIVYADGEGGPKNGVAGSEEQCTALEVNFQ